MAIDHQGTYRERLAEPASQRVGDADRSATCDALSDHFANGRLSPSEFDHRLELAVGAVTVQDLRALTADLPATTSVPPARSKPASPWPMVSVLALVGVIGSVIVAGSMLLVLGLFSPLLFLAAAVGGTAATVGGASTAYLIKEHLQLRRDDA